MRSRALVFIVVAAAALAAAAPAWAAEPVPSLEPAATARLWQRLVAQPPAQSFATQACRPLRGVFYAQTDWLRLATKLAASPSPCAQYYISIPPLAADKTQFRNAQAAPVRALGPSFHPVAEIHFGGWSSWVTSTGSSWFDAGVEARRRMAAANFDVTKGDTWAVNELSSAVRAGTGNARANIREFLRGLYTGDGTQPTRGIAFVIGVGQPLADVSTYQTTLQNWYADAAFWTDMSAYVSDWSQEVYGDVRNYAAPGVPVPTRRDYLNDYLQHQLVLANVAPPTAQVAQAFLRAAYSPLANAAWFWQSAYGWSAVPFELMQAYVSGQVYALRYFSTISAQAADHWGFAWAPQNPAGISSSDFANQTAVILDRLAAAVRDSAVSLDPSDPGSGACGQPGVYTFCLGDLPGSALTEAWKSFRAWTQPALSFTSPPQTIAVGATSGPIALALAQPAAAPLLVTLSSTSPRGVFSASPTGPWTPTLAVTIAQGATTNGAVYYQDTLAGKPTIAAVATGVTSGAQQVTVNAGPATEVQIAPQEVTLNPRQPRLFAATAIDAYGNVVPGAPAWTLDPVEAATLVLAARGKISLRPAGRGGTAALTATIGPAAGTAIVTIRPARLIAASVRYGIGKKVVLLTVKAIDGSGRPVTDARVSVLVRRNGLKVGTAAGGTDAAGKAVFRVASKPGCYTTRVTGMAAPGLVWGRSTPTNRFCK